MPSSGNLILLLLLAVCLIGLAGGWLILRKSLHRLDLWERTPLTSRPAVGEAGPRVVFIGASITTAWPLEEEFPGYEIINAGQGWNFAGQELIRFKGDVLDRDPDAVVIKPCAINFASSLHGLIAPQDPQRIRDELAMMVELANSRSIAVVLCTPIAVGQSFADKHESHQLHGQMQSLREWILGYGEEQDIRIADLYASLADEEGFMQPRYGPDGLHPSREGYVELSRTVRPVLAEALEKRSHDESGE